MIIGITGGSGSGKSTLSRELERRGFLFLDCDVIYHELLKTDKAILLAIQERFPGTVENGVLDRKKLGAIVFSDSEALLDLNKITHTAVKKEVLHRLEARPGNAVIDAIGLFEGELAQLCDLTIAVTAPEDLRVRRLIQREGISEAYARARLASQKSDSFFSTRCDLTIHNNCTSEKSFLADAFHFLRCHGISI